MARYLCADVTCVREFGRNSHRTPEIVSDTKARKQGSSFGVERSGAEAIPNKLHGHSLPSDQMSAAERSAGGGCHALAEADGIEGGDSTSTTHTASFLSGASTSGAKFRQR